MFIFQTDIAQAQSFIRQMGGRDDLAFSAKKLDLDDGMETSIFRDGTLLATVTLFPTEAYIGLSI